MSKIHVWKSAVWVDFPESEPLSMLYAGSPFHYLIGGKTKACSFIGAENSRHSYSQLFLQTENNLVSKVVTICDSDSATLPADAVSLMKAAGSRYRNGLWWQLW